MKFPDNYHDPNLDLWIMRHSDLHHPGSRDDCESCQEIIASCGPMPSVEVMKAYSLVFWRRKRAERYQKRPIPRALRAQVFERDGHRCKHCGSPNNLRADHIHPESRGGATELANLQTLCQSCNSRKGARLPASEDAL